MEDTLLYLVIRPTLTFYHPSVLHRKVKPTPETYLSYMNYHCQHFAKYHPQRQKKVHNPIISIGPLSFTGHCVSTGDDMKSGKKLLVRLSLRQGSLYFL